MGLLPKGSPKQRGGVLDCQLLTRVFGAWARVGYLRHRKSSPKACQELFRIFGRGSLLLHAAGEDVLCGVDEGNIGPDGFAAPLICPPALLENPLDAVGCECPVA